MEKTIPLAPQGVFRTIQGEGVMLGVPMIFVRLAGCSVGCAECDTDYRVASRVTGEQLRDLISRHLYGSAEWVWVTGGEPTDHDLTPVLSAVRSLGLKAALATAGTRQVTSGFVAGGWDFLSVSPHRLDASWVQRSGDQLNIVPGLNGLRLSDLDGVDLSWFPPGRRFVTPNADREGRPTNLKECVEYVTCRPGWRLNVQAHKLWGMP